jgi:hypothetical protein
MKSFFMKAVGAVAMSGALIAAVPAEARSWGKRSGYSDYRGGHGSARVYRNHRGDRGYWNRGYRGYRSYGGYRGYYGYRGTRGYPGYYHYGHYNDDAAVALGAGIIGLAIGAAIASNRNDRYDDRRYDDRYYDDYYRD